MSQQVLLYIKLRPEGDIVSRKLAEREGAGVTSGVTATHFHETRF